MKDSLGVISGQITIDGKHAAGIEAALLPQHYYIREKAIATVKTDNAGRYRFTAVPTGHYWISLHAPGYLNAVHWDEDGPGRNVSVADGQSVENADLELVLGGVIAGRITDAEGSPVVGEYVELTMVDKLGPPDETLDLYADEDELFVTDNSGRYRIYGIPPGRYLVSIGVDVARLTGATRDRYGSSIHPTGQVDGDHYFEQIFHPGVRDRTRAKVIDISAGAAVHNANMTVGRSFRAYKVTGRVIDAESRAPIPQCYIQMGPYTGRGYASSYSTSGPSDTDHDGNFRIEGLLPGRFFVSAQFDGETELYCTPVEFEVRDNDINGLEIKAHRGLTLSGSVTVEGTKREEITTKLTQLKL
ncbi:MAG TPA: carboxypeptidase-like regulatory domain-containing protein, partial [Blastocatellia bacterium]|nr:carboxypeptidase-like regulatory domain-containing protein [Blastocatellia bacterium]